MHGERDGAAAGGSRPGTSQAATDHGMARINASPGRSRSGHARTRAPPGAPAPNRARRAAVRSAASRRRAEPRARGSTKARPKPLTGMRSLIPAPPATDVLAQRRAASSAEAVSGGQLSAAMVSGRHNAPSPMPRSRRDAGDGRRREPRTAFGRPRNPKTSNPALAVHRAATMAPGPCWAAAPSLACRKIGEGDPGFRSSCHSPRAPIASISESAAFQQESRGKLPVSKSRPSVSS